MPTPSNHRQPESPASPGTANCGPPRWRSLRASDRTAVGVALCCGQIAHDMLRCPRSASHDRRSRLHSIHLARTGVDDVTSCDLLWIAVMLHPHDGRVEANSCRRALDDRVPQSSPRPDTPRPPSCPRRWPLATGFRDQPRESAVAVRKHLLFGRVQRMEEVRRVRAHRRQRIRAEAETASGIGHVGAHGFATDSRSDPSGDLRA